ncbi:Neuferricin homolog (Cytochrome b5 domain-containing protein 2 homolog) [Durusdinium trenchii]|uniref:Neuferricin homolog (Cytochrome b5 domain-containing protein 2 homolog) n=1 Tax=Durusdinium trenchii TaxID=1381693 RepID=A0ABP0JU34_9DINO
MAFFCRCSAATGEAALEDGDSAIRQEGDAQLSHMEDVSLQLAKQDQSLGIDEKASEHSTVTPSIQEISMELPTLEAEEKIGKAPEANPLEEVEATEAAPEVKPEPQKAEEKVKRPPEPLTTLDDQNFDDRGVSTLDESKTFYYTLGNDYRCLLTGWTHTRPYAKGFIRNKPGKGKAVVSGLDHGVGYFWKVYQVAKLHGSANGLSVNGEDQGKTNASKSYEATASGKTLADKEGKITFAFTRDGDEVHLSGIAVAREEEKEGKPKPKAKAKVKAKAKNKGKEPKYDEVGRRIDRRKKEESSSDEDLLDDLCPSSRKDADFERELKKMKKKVRAGMTEKQREEMENPWLYTQISDGERSLKKDMFKSFYREQYARLKKSAGPDLKQYQKNDPATGQSVGTSNLKAEGGHRPLPRPKGVKMPKDFQKDVGRISQKDLLEKYGCKGERMLVSVYGDLFDVSDRPDKYGPDGPYWYMTGKDITWALVSGEDSEENMDKFYDIFKIQPQDAADRRLQGLMSWWAFYEKEYGKPVGRNTSYDKEWGLPPPPNIADGCSVM